ncbi:MAG: TPR end-of-group domain-containing protein, partial [Myxococcota bacterium]
MLTLLACADPQLKPFSEAIGAWEEGKALLAEGRAGDAAQRFAAAREKDPRTPALVLWQAKALADAGRLDEADALLSEMLRARPDVGAAWYNRAAYRVRGARSAEAVDDLKEALRLKVRSPLEAAADPDFASVLGDPRFGAILPSQPLLAAVMGPEGSVFVQSDVDVSIRVVSLPDAPVRVLRGGEDAGCLRPVRLVEDVHDEPGARVRTLTLTLRGEGPCDARLGPFTVQAGEWRTELDPVAVRVEAPPGYAPATGVPPLPAALPLPSLVAPADADYAAVRTEAGVVAAG